MEEEEVKEWKKRCPIKRLKAKLLETGLLKKRDTEVIEKEVERKVGEAMEFAIESPYPSPDELMLLMWKILEIFEPELYQRMHNWVNEKYKGGSRIQKYFLGIANMR